MSLIRFEKNYCRCGTPRRKKRNVTRASDRLSIGHSVARAVLAGLREYLGDELLVPDGRQ